MIKEKNSDIVQQVIGLEKQILSLKKNEQRPVMAEIFKLFRREKPKNENIKEIEQNAEKELASLLQKFDEKDIITYLNRMEIERIKGVYGIDIEDFNFERSAILLPNINVSNPVIAFSQYVVTYKATKQNIEEGKKMITAMLESLRRLSNADSDPTSNNKLLKFSIKC